MAKELSREDAVRAALADEEQNLRFQKSLGGRLGKAGKAGLKTVGLEAIFGSLGAATLDPDLPGVEATKPSRNPTWRSDAGRAGAEMRRVVDPLHRSFPNEPGRNLRDARRLVSSPGGHMAQPGAGSEPPSLQRAYKKLDATNLRAANARTIAREAAKKVIPLGAAAQEGLILKALGFALPLVTAPIHFVAGEGPGSFAETQKLEGQLKALARINKGPLDPGKIAPDTLKQIAADPDLFEKLHEAGYLSNKTAEIIGQINAYAHDPEDVERRRALGMME